MRTFIAALAAVLLITAPLAARAQIAPSYAQSADGTDSADAQIHGRVISFDGAYSLQVRDEKGYVDNVQLHPGTIINPTGITLAAGMIVSILGYNSGSYFGANEIDTPYTFYSGVPYYSGHPWDYYGPGVSLGFFFGNAGWWHGGYFGGGYHYVGGARVYNNVRINAVYHGGAFQGHAYVAPAASGGYYHGAQSGGFHGNSGGSFHGGGAVHGGGGGFHGGGGDHHH